MASKKIKIPTDSDLRKSYGNYGPAKLQIPNEEGSLWIPSSVLAFNYQTGGGLPYGKIMEIFGEESAGKTLLANDFAKSTLSLGGVVNYCDAEHTFDAIWAEANGLDLENLHLYQETAVELISDWIGDTALYWRSKLVNNEPILIIIDSVAALDCLENIDSKQTDSKAEMGNRAKAIYKMFRIRNQMLAQLGVSLIAINQLRDKVGASQFQDPNTTPGGKALQFYASQRVGIYRGKQIKAKVNGIDSRVGNNVSIRMIKNKVAPPRASLKTEVYFDVDYKGEVGFNKYIGLPEVLISKGVVTKKGSRYYDDKERMLANGEESFTKLLGEDDTLRKRLVRKSGINTISKTRSKINKLDKNLYPIKGVTNEKHDE